MIFRSILSAATTTSLFFTSLILAVAQPCTIDLNMFDTFQDGWNGANVDVEIRTGGIRDTFAMAAGLQDSTVAIPVNLGDSIFKDYNSSGINGSEQDVYYEFVDFTGTTLFSDGDKIAFSGIPTDDAGLVFIGLAACPVCNPITDAQLGVIDTTSTSISWTGGNPGSTYLVEYGAAGFGRGNGTRVTGTVSAGSNNLNISSLSTETCYDLYLIEICGANDSSALVGPLSFCTGPCGLQQVIPDDGPTSGDSLQFQITVSGVTPTQLGSSILLDQVALIIDHPASNQMDVYLRSPAGATITLTSDNGAGADYGDALNCPGSSTVFSDNAGSTITSGSSPFIGSFNPEQAFTGLHDSSDPNGVWTLIVVDDQSGSTGTLEYVDLQFAEPVTCFDPSDLVTATIDSNQAELEWSTANAGAAYTIEYGPEGFIQGSGSTSTGSTSPGTSTATITGLSSNTCYDWYVRELCGGGDNSEWVGPLTFCTGPCELSIVIPDEGCITGDSVTYDFNVVSNLGDSLGHDVLLESVNLVIAHSFVPDLEIYLRSPSGVTVQLSSGNGGSGANFGNTSACPDSMAILQMDAPKGILANNDAPYIGRYEPDGNLEDFHDDSDPNGLWTLLICDGAGSDVGTLEHISLNLTGGCGPDITPPTIECPADINVVADGGSCDAIVFYDAPFAFDNCPGVLITQQTTGLPSGGTFPIGVTNNTFTVRDGESLSSQCSFSVTVSDVELPEINCPADDTAACAPFFYAVTSSDNCAGVTQSLVSGKASGSLFPQGVTTVVYSATDVAGNSKSCSFNVSNFETVISSVEPKINDTEGGFSGIIGKKGEFGSAVAHIPDLDNDGVDDLVIGASGMAGLNSAGKKQVFAGGIFVNLLNSDGTVKREVRISFGSGGTGGMHADSLFKKDRFGFAIADIGDLNGDGVGDLAVGAPGRSTIVAGKKVSAAGSVFILFMQTDGSAASFRRIDNQTGGFSGGGKKFAFGAALASFDVNGDGQNELLVGAPGGDNTPPSTAKLTASGEVNVLFLNTDGTIASSVNLSHGDLPGLPLSKKDQFGSSIAWLGGNRVAVGAVGNLHLNAEGKKVKDAGAVYVFDLASDGTVSGTLQKISGNDIPALGKKGLFGKSVAAAGDVDGDGFTDIAVGTPNDETVDKSAGAVFIVALNSDGSFKAEHFKVTAPNGAILDKKDLMGWSLSANTSACNAVLAAGAIGDDDSDDGKTKDQGAVYQFFPDGTASLKSKSKKSNPVIEQLAEEGIDVDQLIEVPSTDAQIASMLIYPNPFDNQFTVHFELNRAADAEILMTDLFGRTVFYQAETSFSAGSHKVSIASEDIATGQYFIRVNLAQSSKTVKVIKLNR